MRVPPLRRFVQGAILLLFVVSILRVEEGSLLGLGVDSLLRLDPLAGISLPLTLKSILPILWPVLLVYLSAVFFGRVFCGWFCPMGTTLDLFGSLIRIGKKRKKEKRLPHLLNVLFLFLILTAALCGINLVFLGAPLPLTARFYALLLFPLGEMGFENGLLPFLTSLGYEGLRYREITTHFFATASFLAFFWGACIILERVRPRFWCRYLCPAGALLGLLARWAPWRFRVDEKSCVSCGHCSWACPAGLAESWPALPKPSECLGCKQCLDSCSYGAIRFGRKTQSTSTLSPPSLSRRAFLGAALLGGTLGAIGAAKGKKETTLPVRPPGSIPEERFLALCLRCGACMRACPTGGLQPLWREGLSSLFSPILTPRMGPCRPECSVCGTVCPTNAILALHDEEKRWAKIGTAVIDERLCLALAEDKRCMVCKENCPYGAIDVRKVAGKLAPVPFVQKTRCYGCGYCEKYCPKTPSAIVVTAEGALRLTTPHYAAKAKEEGLLLRITDRSNDPDTPKEERFEGPPPGFLE